MVYAAEPIILNTSRHLISALCPYQSLCFKDSCFEIEVQKGPLSVLSGRLEALLITSSVILLLHLQVNKVKAKVVIFITASSNFL